MTACREFVVHARESLFQEFREHPTGSELCARHSAVFDVLLAELYRLATDSVEERGDLERGEATLCVAAVGGYGRASLAPWSDIDVVMIPSEEAHPFTDLVVRELTFLLADILTPGVLPQPAHSYRPLSDLGLIDHQTATALLESRRIAGDGSLHIHFMQSLMRSIDPVEFLELNLKERQEVWDSPRESLYAVEPNLKSGPGGLRDFHAAIWVAKVVYHVPDWDVLQELQRTGVITQVEREQVVKALEFNLLCRNWLHLRRGLKLDVLHADYQPEMAGDLGYRDEGKLAAHELLMADCYANARVIADFSRRLAATAREQRLGYRDGLYVERWTFYPAHDGVFGEDPTRLVQVFRECQRLRMARSLQLDRLVASHAAELGEGVRTLAAGAAFLEILSSADDVAGTLRAMHETGVLAQVLPEFDPLMHFLPGDPAHEYTVGEHSLKVVEEIQRLRDHPTDEHEQMLSGVVRGLQEPEVLYFAALFHDVGKRDRSGDHSNTGAVVAERVARRLGFQESAVSRIDFLVRHHLDMMRTARLGALAMPWTIERFAGILPQSDPVDALDMLVALTYGDTRSVGVDVLREHDTRQLLELFVKTLKWVRDRPLEGEAVSIERVTRRLAGAEALRDIPGEMLQRHLDRMPTWYAVNTPPALIAKHIAYLDRVSRSEDPVVEFYHALNAMHTEVTVCTKNRRGLLRDIAATVTANNLDINLAHLDVCEPSGERPDESIATIWVDDFGHPLGPQKRNRLQSDIEKVLTDEEDVPSLLTRRGKSVPTSLLVHSVKVSNADSQQHTVVVIRAGDQRGLLYRLADALLEERLDIVVAKVTTWRGAAEDAFYVVSNRTGHKVPDEETDTLATRISARLTGERVEELTS
ncbi:MAG: HD domain-containing protein [Armatimonadetes bacterium]|nr:HD domain-containing protein [Armatimonadota bacterium]